MSEGKEIYDFRRVFSIMGHGESTECYQHSKKIKIMAEIAKSLSKAFSNKVYCEKKRFPAIIVAADYIKGMHI